MSPRVRYFIMRNSLWYDMVRSGRWVYFFTFFPFSILALNPCLSILLCVPSFSSRLAVLGYFLKPERRLSSLFLSGCWDISRYLEFDFVMFARAGGWSPGRNSEPEPSWQAVIDWQCDQVNGVAVIWPYRACDMNFVSSLLLHISNVPWFGTLSLIYLLIPALRYCVS